MAERIIIQRHGQTVANTEGRWHGSTDGKLNWRGRWQAKRTARFLAARQDELNIEAIIASPLLRCQNTAAPTAKRLGQEVQTCDDLREFSVGDWENETFQALRDEHNFYQRASNDLNFAPPGGESLNGVAQRFIAALQGINAKHQGSVLVVTHGAALATALAALLDDDPRQWTNYLVNNCSLTEVVLGERPYANYFNRTEHL